MEIQCHIDLSNFEYKPHPHLNQFARCIKTCNEFSASASTKDFTRVFVIREGKFRKLMHGKTLVPLVEDILKGKSVEPFLVMIDLQNNKIQLLK
jgi:hypothetical protein